MSVRLLISAGVIALFAGLVYAVLLAAHVAEPAATTVHGPTLRRLWATSAAGLALCGLVLGGLTLARPTGRFGTLVARLGAVVIGAVAAVNGGLVLAVAHGGPGTGNGVVGAAGAVVLGLIAAALGSVALARPAMPARNRMLSHRSHRQPPRF